MPYMQAIGVEKDELVQALGVFFTVATIALAFNLTGAGLLTASTALPGAVALAGAFIGMLIGQAVRSQMQPEAFRRWFLIAMILLGIYCWRARFIMCSRHSTVVAGFERGTTTF